MVEVDWLAKMRADNMGHLKKNSFTNGGYILNNKGKAQKTYGTLVCDENCNLRCTHLCLRICLEPTFHLLFFINNRKYYSVTSLIQIKV